MSGKTVFEQPGRWNYLVDDSIPLSWRHRWRLVHLVLPILAVSAVLLFETILLRAWFDDHLNADSWTRALISPFLVGGLFLASLELRLRVSHKSRRRLILNQRTASFSHSKHWIRWNQVLGCRFERIVDEPGLTRFFLVYQLNPKTMAPRTWEMVFSSSDEISRLQRELSAHARTDHRFAILETDETRQTAVRPSPNSKGVWLWSIGFFLLVHGVGPLMAALNPFEAQSHSQEHKQNSEPRERRIQFVRKHFKSPKSLRLFCGITGGTLSGAGLWLIILAGRMSEKREVSPKNYGESRALR